MLGSGWRRRGRPQTLRVTWWSTLAKFVAIIVAVMALAVAVYDRERSQYAASVDEVAARTSAVAALDKATLESLDPMTVSIYRNGPADTLAAAAAAYDVARANVEDAFDAARVSMQTDRERDVLAGAEGIWDGIDRAVLTSLDDFSDEELFGMLRAGNDPFRASVWDPYYELNFELTDVLNATVEDMEQTLSAAENTRRTVLALFGVSLVLAVCLALLAARRMSHRVLHPLEELVASARLLQGTRLEQRIDLPDAASELHALASAFNESAASLHRSTNQLRRQAYTDSLTSLPNRKAFTEQLERSLADADGGAVAVLFIDLDDFKDVNDTQGHAAGDALLQIVASRLLSAVRGSDVVARLGGDEFAVIAHTGDQDDITAVATAVADRILASMQHPVHLDARPVSVGCSIGIALSGTAPSIRDADDLLAGADFAMYMAKGQGKNRYELHSQAMHADMLARTEVRRDLPQALRDEQFELHYQPILDLSSQHLLGFEALIRWNHPTRGFLQPKDFIALAEESGAIIDIGQWVMDHACRTLAELHRNDPALFMTVNISAQQLSVPGFARTTFLTAVNHGVPTDRLVLEITEETAIFNTTDESNALRELREHGFHLALDDFGTGFSSLRYLGEIPADMIKIDRSFLCTDKSAMLESIIALAQRLSLQIIAEGIEEEADFHRLRSYGALAGQGYLFAEAMPEQQLAAYTEVGPASRPDLDAGRC